MSMLEIIFAFTMFVTVMVPLMSVWVTHARAYNQTQDQEVAGALAQMYMEQALNQGYSGPSVPLTTLTVERTLRGVVETAIFNYTITVTDPANPLIANMLPATAGPPSPSHRVVVVAVTYSDSTGNHTVSLESNATW